MTMSQAATEHHVGPISLSNGCKFASNHGAMEPMDLSGPQASTSVSNEKAGIDDEQPAGPLCRRSTRASALKAAEKIKLKDDITGMEPSTASDDYVFKREEPDEEEIPTKKRKIADPSQLNQMSHTFYIQQEADGTVVEVDEETEISSINSEEAAGLKAQYEKLMSKELSDEQVRERNSIIKNLEADLRREESKLTLMRKIVGSQQMAKANEAKKLASNVSLNNGGAYKPALATSKNGTTNNKGNSQIALNPDAINLLLKLNLEQQKDFIIRANKTSPQVVPQLVQAIAKTNCATQAQLAQLVQAIQAAQKHEAAEKAAAAKEAAAREQQNQQTNTLKTFANATPAQRAAQARQAFRLQADKQLTQIANYKSHPADLSFIPNPTQPDFCSLVALDIIVQRILKDKAAVATVTEKPYECEQCGTDFTPSWKATGTPDDLHLFCEQCFRDQHKKKIQKDHTNFLRKAFNKVSTQEKEFEKQIADGKLDAVVAAAAAQQQAQQQAAQAAASTSHAQNLSTRQNGSNTPAKSSTPVPSKLSTPSSSTTTPQSKKTTASNNLNMTQQAQQMAQMAMILRNPMMAAMMTQMQSQMQSQVQSNPALMMQMYNPMIMQMMVQQMQQQQQNQSRNSQQSNQATQSNYAMALLAQAAVQSAAQGSSSGSANPMAQLAGMSQLQMNPQMMRQIQQMQQKLSNLKK